MNLEHHHADKCKLCDEELGLVYKKEEVDKLIEELKLNKGEEDV